MGIRLLHEALVEAPLEGAVGFRHRASGDNEDAQEHLRWKCDDGGEDVAAHVVGVVTEDNSVDN